MSLIVARKSGNMVAVSSQPRSTRRARRQQAAPVVRLVQPTNVGQVSSPRRRRRNVNRSRNGTDIAAPSSFGRLMQGSRVKFSSPNAGQLTLTHSEVLGDEVLGTSSFSGTLYPMIPSTFAYLKGIAENFSRFRWKSLRVAFITSSPTSQGGTVAMGAQYDGLDNLPGTIGEVAAMSHGCLGPVWGPPGSSVYMDFDCSRWSRPWYSYYDGAVSLEDAVSYIPAYFVLGKQTQVNGQPIGRIEVQYSIEFVDPLPANIQLHTPGQRKNASDTFSFGAEEVRAPDPMEVMLRAIAQLVIPADTQGEEPVGEQEG